MRRWQDQQDALVRILLQQRLEPFAHRFVPGVGLAVAVNADDTDDLARADFEIDPAPGRKTAVVAGEDVAQFENGVPGHLLALAAVEIDLPPDHHVDERILVEFLCRPRADHSAGSMPAAVSASQIAPMWPRPRP